MKPKTWRGLVPADANWSRLLVVTTDQKGNAKRQTKVFTPLVVIKKKCTSQQEKEKYFENIKFKIRNIFTLPSQHGGKSYFTHSTMQESTVNHGKFVQVGIYAALN